MTIIKHLSLSSLFLSKVKMSDVIIVIVDVVGCSTRQNRVFFPGLNLVGAELTGVSMLD
jgi:uncharacterized protein YjbI with pentapeptide repeats